MPAIFILFLVTTIHLENTALILLPDFILIIFAWGLNRFTALNRVKIWVAFGRVSVLGFYSLVCWCTRLVAQNYVWADNVSMLLLLAVCMMAMALIVLRCQDVDIAP
jgi:hypothetical protein